MGNRALAQGPPRYASDPMRSGVSRLWPRCGPARQPSEVGHFTEAATSLVDSRLELSRGYPSRGTRKVREGIQAFFYRRWRPTEMASPGILTRGLPDSCRCLAVGFPRR